MSSCACRCEERGCKTCCYCGRSFDTKPASKVLVVNDENAGIMLFKDLKAFEADCKSRGMDAGSDYKLMMENLLRGESFADKTTSFEWYTVHEGPVPE